MKYTEKQINDLLDGIFDGSITVYDLPEDYYIAITNYLKEGLYKGFGMTFEEASGKDLELLGQLRENIYMFGAAKTYQEVKEISGMLVDEDGVVRSRSEFNKLGRETYDKWNNDWGKTEYNTAIGQATMASKWNEIEKQKEILPNLRYSTIGDACDICEPLDGLVAPVDDPVWDDIMPLNHFNCACIVLQEDADIELTPDAEKEETYNDVTGKMNDVFKNNAGKTGTVFPKDHPYFDVDKNDKKYAQGNFNFDIPKSD